MRERPIIFSAPMVRAILEGRKTQTRRVVATDLRPQSEDTMMRGFPPNPQRVRMLGDYAKCDAPPGSPSVSYRVPCPYGVPGDRLWVRETSLPDFPKEFSFYDWTWAEVPEEYRKPEHVLYAATWTGHGIKWNPSIHMPRWASRITLEIVSVRVERVQDIRGRDCVAEGVTLRRWERNEEPLIDPGVESETRELRAAYARLWDSINGKKAGHGWDDNPFVWVIEFKRVESAEGHGHA